jgi:hypothetical protein
MAIPFRVAVPKLETVVRPHYAHPNYSAAVEFGMPYAPNVIVPWITHGTAVDVTWLMSTWNPYGVYVMRTRINAIERRTGLCHREPAAIGAFAAP